MERFLSFYAKIRADQTVDEGLGEAARILANGDRSMADGNLILWLVLGGAILLVVVALIVTYGRIRRTSGDRAQDSEELFDQRFSDDYDMSQDPFGVADGRSGHAAEDEAASDPRSLFAEEAEVSFSEEPAEVEAPQNVVPLRVPEPAPEPEPEPQETAQPLRREAAATYQAAEPRTPGMDFRPMRGGPDDVARDREESWAPVERPAASARADDEDAPFVAPFIREYIEDSERRQSQRLDELRDDMRRQLNFVREEQSSRLDLFLGSIERKIASAAPMSAAPVQYEEDPVTRRHLETLADVVDRISAAVERHGERLSELGRAVDNRFTEMAPVRTDVRSLHEDIVSFKRDAEGSTAAVGQLRDAIDALKEDMTRLEQNFLERAQGDQSVTMRLVDVLRGTLDADEYQLSARLSNGHSADALIMLAGGKSRVAVDGRFPIEVFNRLPSRDAVRRNLRHAREGEEEFRRTVLRAIFACADNCIVDGETTDSAILFLPSEAAYTILHDRFPDLVRDSHRARVSLTSPSTLMGTLALLHNIFDDHDTADEPEFSYAVERSEEGPFYTGPEGLIDDLETDEEPDLDTETIEARLRQLRSEEDKLAKQLDQKKRQRSSRTYARADEPQSDVSSKSDEFERRFERFAFDLDADVDDEEREPRGFRRDRDDPLR